MTSQPKRMAILLALVLLVSSTGCWRTVHQKAIYLAELGTTGYKALRGAALVYKTQFEALRETVAALCPLAETSAGVKACDAAREAARVADAAWAFAERADATAAEIGKAKDRTLVALEEMERAVAENTTPP